MSLYPSSEDGHLAKLWGYKFVGTDLCTDDHQGGRFRYRLGEWHETSPDRAYTRGECPAFPGDGLCIARTLSGAQSGGARLGASVMVLVGYEQGDVLAESADKVRVKRLYVAPDPVDPIAAIIGPGADLRDAYLRGAYLRGADLRGADLGGAVRPSWLPAKWTVTANGYVTERTS